MFTGIISNLGKLISLEKKNFPVLTIEVDFSEKIKVGDSVAVNGVCLTVTEFGKKNFRFNLSPETLKLSNFGDLPRGSFLNLELPLKLNDFLGGHLVSGHLDGVVRVKSISGSKNNFRFTFIYQNRDGIGLGQ